MSGVLIRREAEKIRCIQELDFNRTTTTDAIRKDACKGAFTVILRFNRQKRSFIDRNFGVNQTVAEQVAFIGINLHPCAAFKLHVTIKAFLRTMNRKIRINAFVNLTVAENAQRPGARKSSVDVIGRIRFARGRTQRERHIIIAGADVQNAVSLFSFSARNHKAIDCVISFDISTRFLRHSKNRSGCARVRAESTGFGI